MKRIIAIVSSLIVFGAAVFTGIQLHQGKIAAANACTAQAKARIKEAQALRKPAASQTEESLE